MPPSSSSACRVLPTTFITAAHGSAGVVAATSASSWFLPAAALADEARNRPAAAAEAPEIGTDCRYRLYTHCGTENARVLIAGSIWLVDPEWLTDGYWPPAFEDPDDPGVLRLVSEDRARYTSRNGGDVFFDRTDTPPPFPFCA